jgi:hypothetical protein
MALGFCQIGFKSAPPEERKRPARRHSPEYHLPCRNAGTPGAGGRIPN